MAAAANVEDYIASFPPDVREVLARVRATLATAVPGSGETIRYGMPAVMSNGRYVVHYAGWKHHIGMYPIPRLAGPMEDEIAPYRAAKDTIRLPLRAPIPYALIARLAAVIAEMRGGEEAESTGISTDRFAVEPAPRVDSSP